MDRPLEFSQHALDLMPARGATKAEVEAALSIGERVSPRPGTAEFRKNFTFEGKWKKRYYETKQVGAVVREGARKNIVLTVFVFYFGGHT